MGDCTASGCTNTGNCNGASACQVPAGGSDPNNFCSGGSAGCSACNGAGSCLTYTCYGRNDGTASCAGGSHCTTGGACIADNGGYCD